MASDPRCTSRLFAAVVFAATLGPLSATRADVPPPDSCTMPGQPCGTEPSCTCKESTCTRALPCSLCGAMFHCDMGGFGGSHAGAGAGDEDDGGLPLSAGNSGLSGFCTVKYPCNRCSSETGTSCLTIGGRSGGAGSTAGAAAQTGGTAGHAGGAGTGGAGAAGSGGHKRHSGCSAAGSDLTQASFALLGVWAWLMLRRRRAT